MQTINIFWTINLLVLALSIIICHWIGIKETYYKITLNWHSYAWKTIAFCFVIIAIILVIVIEYWVWVYLVRGV